MSALDDAALSSLADALATLATPQERMPHEALVALAGLGADVTVDVAATAVLGFPLVVVRPTEPEPIWWASLTAREREVALLIADGFANKTIGTRLNIRLATVKDHVHAVLRKSGLRRRTQVASLLAPIQDRLSGAIAE